MILPIRGYGDPILRERAQEVDQNTPELQKLIDDMIETMRRADGAGLAAPQVGEALRLFVADLKAAWKSLAPQDRPKIPRQPMVVINPEIVSRSEATAEFSEGCLSVPGLVVDVKRPIRITMRYLDRDFRPQTIEGFSTVASVLQHEFDHLNGVLHIDHLSTLSRARLVKQLRRIERGDVETTYPMQFAGGSVR